MLAGDIALVLGVLALVGPRCPPQLRVLLLTLVLVGDVTAVAVIALRNGEVVNILALAVVLELFAVVTVLRLLRVLRTFAYLVVGVALWVATSVSGIHPAMAGLLLGVVITAYPPVPTEVLRTTRLGRWFEPDPTPAMLWEAPLGVGEAVHPTQRLQQLLHPWSSYLVVPLFVLANAGITLDRELLARAVGSPITLGVLAGLVVGKLVGIVGASLLAVRAGLGPLPRLVTRQQLAAAAALAVSVLRSRCSSPTSPSPIRWPRTRPSSGSWSPRRPRPRSAGRCSTCPAAGRTPTPTRRLAATPQQRGDSRWVHAP